MRVFLSPSLEKNSEATWSFRLKFKTCQAKLLRNILTHYGGIILNLGLVLYLHGHTQV